MLIQLCAKLHISPVDKYVDHKDVLTLTINKNKNKKFKRLRFFRGIDKIINIFLIYFFSRSEITERFPKPNQSVQKNTWRRNLKISH